MLLKHFASSDKWFRTRHYSDETGACTLFEDVAQCRTQTTDVTILTIRVCSSVCASEVMCVCLCARLRASEVMCACVCARKWGNANDGDGQYDPWGESLWCGVVVDAHCGGTMRSVTRITFKNRTCILLLQQCNDIHTSKIVVPWGFKNLYRV